MAPHATFFLWVLIQTILSLQGGDAPPRVINYVALSRLNEPEHHVYNISHNPYLEYVYVRGIRFTIEQIHYIFQHCRRIKTFINDYGSHLDCVQVRSVLFRYTQIEKFIISPKANWDNDYGLWINTKWVFQWVDLGFFNHLYEDRDDWM